MSMFDFNKKIAEEWKTLPEKRKQFYQKIYEIRIKEKCEIQEEFARLTHSKKAESGYLRFYKKRFAQLSKEHKNVEKKEINRMVSVDWRSLTNSEK